MRFNIKPVVKLKEKEVNKIKNRHKKISLNRTRVNEESHPVDIGHESDPGSSNT